METIDLIKAHFSDRFLGANGSKYVYIGKQFLEGTIGCMLVSYYNEEDRFGKPIHKNKSKQRRERRKSQRSNRR